jgi:acetyltransferase-like isoleucine patch superfamily enzyme
MLNRVAITGALAGIISFPKIALLKLRGVDVKLFTGVRIFGWPKIVSPRSIHIAPGVTLGRFVRIEGNVTLGQDVFINEFSSLGGSKEAPIRIEAQSRIGPGCYLTTSDHDIALSARVNKGGQDTPGRSGSITINQNCWLGTKVIILKGVTLGEGAVIGAGSVVTKDVPQNAVAVGNPAKVIKYRS